jgi:hypothetical protein
MERVRGRFTTAREREGRFTTGKEGAGNHRRGRVTVHHRERGVGWVTTGRGGGDSPHREREGEGVHHMEKES